MLYRTTCKYYTFNQAIIKQIAVVVSGVLTEDNHYLSGRNDHAAKGSPPATRTATDGNYCYIATVDPDRYQQRRKGMVKMSGPFQHINPLRGDALARFRSL
ncbi:hypothetical protein EAP62_06170 [Salmonella enterica]|nr:hypothetical protein [Salmonella enterica]